MKGGFWMGYNFFISFATIINLIIILVSFSIVTYGFVLFVKLAKRGIKALDIYINEKTNNKL